MHLGIWIGFIALIIGLLVLDLVVVHRRHGAPTFKESSLWSVFWIALGLAFSLVIHYLYARGLAGDGSLDARSATFAYLTAYVVEKSLSVDNLFVFALIFSRFNVPLDLQHPVLFWGILGALILRGIMIAVGAVLLARFSWMTYVFGAFLIFTAVRLLVARREEIHPEGNLLLRLARKLFPVTEAFEGARFFLRRAGKLTMTPLFVVLLLVESTDVVFAVDSIPAVFAVTRDPILVFTSNVFAILGLRALFMVLAGAIHRFKYLKTSLVFLLAYVGVKMLLAEHYHIPAPVSLAFIAGILTVGVLASLRSERADAEHEA
ncbi:TerC family protein [bacterium]|nr:TerC family protein [bacterium]